MFQLEKTLFLIIINSKKIKFMKTSAPKKNLWIMALLLGFLGIISHFIEVPYVSVYSFWLLLVGFVLLFIGTTFKGV